MDNQPVDGLKKGWFMEGLRSSLRKKMKIIPLALYEDAYNRAMDLESDGKTSKKKKDKSSGDDGSSESSNDEDSSKKVHALQKDMHRMMREFKAIKGSSSKNKGDLWCADCEEGHTEGTCPKKTFCDICQVQGHSTKECLYNMKTRIAQVLLTQEQPSTATIATSPQQSTNTTTSSYLPSG